MLYNTPKGVNYVLYTDFYSYISNYIDMDLFLCFSLSVAIAFIIVYLAYYSSKQYITTLYRAIDKCSKGERLSKKEERIYDEYQEYKGIYKDRI